MRADIIHVVHYFRAGAAYLVQATKVQALLRRERMLAGRILSNVHLANQGDRGDSARGHISRLHRHAACRVAAQACELERLRIHADSHLALLAERVGDWDAHRSALR